MDRTAVLQTLDQERQTVAPFGTTLAAAPNVVRAFGPLWSGIAFSRFARSESDRVIDQEINYWSARQKSFEWTVYDHDEPPDLTAKLRQRGFKIGNEEALMILDVADFPETLLVYPQEKIEIKRVTDEGTIADLLSVQKAIWNNKRLTPAVFRARLKDPLQRDVAFLAYCDEEPVAFARLTSSPDSEFAGLWSGSVLEEYRGKGVYRALLAARIALAKTRSSVRYLRVDALPTSRPILQKYGFIDLAKIWPCDWAAGTERKSRKRLLNSGF